MEEEKTFLQILEELPDSTDNIVKVDNESLASFCNDICSHKSIKGVIKIEDIVSKFEASLDMIDEMMKVSRQYTLLDSIFEKLKSNIDFNYYSYMVEKETLNEI